MKLSPSIRFHLSESHVHPLERLVQLRWSHKLIHNRHFFRLH